MATKQKIPALLAREAEILASPIIRAIDSEVHREMLLNALGISLELNTDLDEIQLIQFLQTVKLLWDTVKGIVDNPPDTIPEIKKAFEDCQKLYKEIKKLEGAIKSTGGITPDNFKDVGKDLLDFLIIIYISRRFPIGYAIGILLTIIEDYDYIEEKPVSIDSTKSFVRTPYKISRIRFDRLKQLINDPFKVLGDEYGVVFNKNSSVTAEDGAAKFFPRLGLLLSCLGFEYVIGIREEYGVDMDQTVKDIAPTLMSFFWENLVLDIDMGITLGFSGAKQGNLGLVIIPFGNWTYSKTFNGWVLNIKAGGDMQAVAIKDGQVTWGGTQQKHILIEASLDKQLNDSYVIGAEGSSGLEIEEIGFSGKMEFRQENGKDNIDFYIQADIRRAHIYLSPGDGDGFLNKVLPKNGFKADFDFGIGYDSSKGLYVTGGVGFEYRKDLNIDLFNIIHLDAIVWALKTGDKVLNTYIAVDGGLTLGPFAMVVEGIGVKAKVEPADSGGNLGPFDIGFAFKPPTGLGLSIDATAVSGGGYLYCDHEKKEYAGVAALSIKNKIAIKAIGILNTELPGGEKGYSLLLIIMAEFTPIQLSFGFTLNGVGGMIGLHRTVNLDALREGLRTRAYDNLLFPADPVKNAPTIISGLKAIFPIGKDRYAFGIMAKIGWGSPTLITIDLGLIIEVPNPVRLAILGVIKAIIPNESSPKIQLRSNFLGIIEFEKKRLSFDASIFDSKILTLSLEGDMALRMSWGSQPSFLLSVGGFHPSFQAPAGLTGMRRMTINLLGGDNPRVSLASYFAITSNTVQFGARVDVFVKVSNKLTAEGAMGFDALFQFKPFYFTIAAYAYLSLKWNGKEKMSLSLNIAFEGPTPYKLNGEGEVKILGIEFKVRVVRTWGETDSSTVATVSVKGNLETAIKELRNWNTSLPAGRLAPVTLRKMDNLNGLMHPMGDLKISQTVLPLDINVERFGNNMVSDGGVYRVDTAAGKIGNTTFTSANISSDMARENFAPSQFRNMSDSEKISSPSFELYNGGVLLRKTGMGLSKTGSDLVRDTAPVEHELIVIGADASLPKLNMDQEITAAAIKSGPSGSTSYSAATVQKSILAPPALTIRQEKFAIVNTADMLRAYPYDPGNPILSDPNSFTEATDKYRQLVQFNPALKTKLQIVPASFAKS